MEKVRVIRIFGTDWKLWAVFAACLVVSQMINLWGAFPNYEGRSVFGFPLVYYSYREGTELVYFNVIFFLLDLLVWYLVAKGIMYGARQLTKYKILK
ncbi:MAG: hypothetical protein JXC85_02275 [Candidatus Aenigmarchaeota archaeon]|nr:hypothetical protein [Candidatus Aenigmarchaeota archaeon]